MKMRSMFGIDPSKIENIGNLTGLSSSGAIATGIIRKTLSSARLFPSV